MAPSTGSTASTSALSQPLVSTPLEPGTSGTATDRPELAMRSAAGTSSGSEPLHSSAADDAPVGLASQDTAVGDDPHTVDTKVEHVHNIESTSAKSDSRSRLELFAVIPKNNLPVVLFAISLSMFLAALDQTIVSTALSTISRELDGTTGSLSWVSGAYLLMITALAPCSGKISDYFGRKVVLYSAIVIFIIGSALCGAAQNIIWLCVCRGIQGLGGGGIVQMSQIIISDITPLESRAKYTGVVGATWGVAACIGPLLGGVFTEKASWRWCFFVNLPCGAIALALLVFFLKLNPPNPPKLSFLLSNFDFAGLGLLVSGLVVLLVGFTSGEASWSSAQTIACLVVGIVILGLAICVELKTKRSPIIPPRLFRIRTSAGLLLGCFLHSFSFISLSYYEPLYFQALGSTPLMSGVLLMPFSVGTAVFGVLAGFLVVRIKRTKELIIVSYLIAVIGYALLATLDETSSRAKQILYLLVAAIGVGPLFQLPMLHLQASMPQKDMATSTATLALLRSIGGTVGISVVGAVYANRLSKGLSGVDGYETPNAAAAVGNVQGLTKIEPIEVRQQVLHAYARALSFPWIICAPLLGVAFLASLIIKHYTFKRGATVAAREGATDGTVTTNEE
ncbi:MFS general substrate transporter [Rhodotorula sp. JG-1b]|nr:MFS general substrate transporter [Rhodotorula sp. JG-1b]